MTQFNEGHITFEFGPRWRVDKWDECAVFTSGLKKLNGELTDGAGIKHGEGSKAVDFVGVLDNEKLYLVEVKDFRGHRIDNQRRLDAELPLEIGLKAPDTLAGLVGNYTTTGATDLVGSADSALCMRKH